MLSAQDLVDWLNDNSAAVQAVTTVVLVIVTGYYAALTRRMVREAERSQRPYVYFELFGEGGNYLELGVSNYGTRAAHNLRFEVHRSITDVDGADLTAETPLKRGLTYLPPGRGLRWSMYPDSDMFGAPAGEHVLDVTLRYDHANHTYDDRIVLDLSDLTNVLIRSLQNADESIAKELKSMTQEFRRRRPQTMTTLDIREMRRPCRFCREPVAISATKCPHCLSDDPMPPADETEAADPVNTSP